MVANNNISTFAGVTLAIVGAFLLITFSTKVLCLNTVKVNLRKQFSYSNCWWLNHWNHVGLVMCVVCFRSHALLVNIVSVIPFAFLSNMNHVFWIVYWKFSVKLQGNPKTGFAQSWKVPVFYGKSLNAIFLWKVLQFLSFFNFECSLSKTEYYHRSAKLKVIYINRFLFYAIILTINI